MTWWRTPPPLLCLAPPQLCSRARATAEIDANPRSSVRACARPSACVTSVRSPGLGGRRPVLRSGNGGGKKRSEQVGARPADGTPPTPPIGREGARRDPSLSTREPPSIVLWPRPPLGTPFAPWLATYWLQVTPLLELPVPTGSSSTLSSPGVSYWRRPRPLIFHQTPPSVWAPPPTIFHSFCIWRWVLGT